MLMRRICVFTHRFRSPWWPSARVELHLTKETHSYQQMSSPYVEYLISGTRLQHQDQEGFPL